MSLNNFEKKTEKTFALEHEKPTLTILTVNFNSCDFIANSIRAIEGLTVSKWKMVICDNGSDQDDLVTLRKLISNYANVELIIRNQSKFGSYGHGEALNALSKYIDTPYGAVLDADCLPMMYGWDSFLIEKLDEVVKIAGTPVAGNSPGIFKRDTTFPQIFMCLFDAVSVDIREIDFRPRNILEGEDTGWQMQQYFLLKGYKAFSLTGKNTRSYKKGVFAKTICDEYYANDQCDKLICTHFGRGSNKKSKKYKLGFLSFNNDKKKWLSICSEVIKSEVQKKYTESIVLAAIVAVGPMDSMGYQYNSLLVLNNLTHYFDYVLVGSNTRRTKKLGIDHPKIKFFSNEEYWDPIINGVEKLNIKNKVTTKLLGEARLLKVDFVVNVCINQYIDDINYVNLKNYCSVLLQRNIPWGWLYKSYQIGMDVTYPNIRLPWIINVKYSENMEFQPDSLFYQSKTVEHENGFFEYAPFVFFDLFCEFNFQDLNEKKLFLKNTNWDVGPMLFQNGSKNNILTYFQKKLTSKVRNENYQLSKWGLDAYKNYPIDSILNMLEKKYESYLRVKLKMSISKFMKKLYKWKITFNR